MVKWLERNRGSSLFIHSKAQSTAGVNPLLNFLLPSQAFTISKKWGASFVWIGHKSLAVQRKYHERSSPLPMITQVHLSKALNDERLQLRGFSISPCLSFFPHLLQLFSYHADALRHFAGLMLPGDIIIQERSICVVTAIASPWNSKSTSHQDQLCTLTLSPVHVRCHSIYVLYGSHLVC